LTVDKSRGVAGLKFAFAWGLYSYHSPDDSPEYLDPSALQQQGENALATAPHISNLDLDDVRRSNIVYLSVLTHSTSTPGSMVKTVECSPRSSSGGSV
jgi:hypothetical protein